MRIPRIHFRLWILMAFIAAAAVFCWLAVRRDRYSRLAEYHESRLPALYAGGSKLERAKGRHIAIMVGSLLRGMQGLDVMGHNVWDWEAEWHRVMAERYRRAASWPWISEPTEPSRSAFRQEFYKRRRAEYDAHNRPAIENRVISTDG
jgi:hypothetical protein